MVWTTPISWPRGLLASSSIMNEQIRDNLNHLHDLLRTISRPSNFAGVVLGTHPSADMFASKIYLQKGEWIVVSDDDGNAEAITITTPLVADMATVGANGRDAGSESASTWYEIYLIRKSSDGSVALLLSEFEEIYASVASTSVGASFTNLRETASLQKVAQGFQTTEDDLPFSFCTVRILRVGSPTGYVWMTIETDNSGSPSGTAIAESPKIDVSTLDNNAEGDVIFWADTVTANLLTAVPYHLVLNSDAPTSASNYLRIVSHGSSVYANGQVKTYNGSVWTGSAIDLYFNVAAKRDAVAVVMPTGYDQKCKLGYVRNNSSSDLTRFVAHDRTVTPAEAAILAASSLTTAQRILTIDSFVPPIPVRLRCVLATNTSSGGACRVAPVRGGHGPLSNVPRAAGGQAVIFDASAAENMSAADVVNTDFAKIYATTSGASAYVSSWEWL
jgi:hypothetical protein